MYKKLYNEALENIKKSISIFLSDDSLNEHFEDDMASLIESIDNAVFYFGSNDFQTISNEISKANSSGDEVGVVESILKLKIFMVNIENSFSEVSDALEKIAYLIREQKIKEAELQLQSLGCDELLSKNFVPELGTFMHDLHIKQYFEYF